MTTKQATVQTRTEAEGGRIGYMMTFIAWIVLGAGILLCLLNVSEFNDSNMGLMVGIGCLIGSVQIYLIGAAVRLFQLKKHSDGSQS